MESLEEQEFKLDLGVFESSGGKGEIIPDKSKDTRKYTGVRKCRAESSEATENTITISLGEEG